MSISFQVALPLRHSSATAGKEVGEIMSSLDLGNALTSPYQVNLRHLAHMHLGPY